MDYLHIPASIETPEIRFDFARHCLVMRGESYPANAASFYEPVGSRLKNYLDTLPADCHVGVDIALSYSAGSSARAIRRLIGLLDRAAAGGRSISVDWRLARDDHMTLEFGSDLMEEFSSLKFSMILAETGTQFRRHDHRIAAAREQSLER